MSAGDPGDLLGPQPGHQRVVLGLVADVAGPVLLLEPADHVLEALRCRAAPTAARGARRAGRARTRRRGSARSAKRGSISGRSAASGSRHGSDELARKVSESRITGRAVGDRDARRLQHRVEALRRRRRRRPSGSGDSPWRPWIAISRSAASVLVGIPVEGPARWTSITSSGSSSADGEPDRLLLQVHPGAARRGDPEVAAEGRARAPCSPPRSRPRPGRCAPRSACGARARAGARTPG